MSQINSVLQDSINKLEKNPLFQMSLGSKELYHSNFLAWALGLDNQMNFSIEFFKHLFRDKIEGVNISKINPPKREKMNIDLIFIFETDETTIRVVIENKVKSLPYLYQLEDYARKIENNWKGDTIYCLLSLVTPNFNPSPWLLRTYANVADALDHALPFIESNEEQQLGMANLILSYIEFIRSLDVISKSMSISLTESFDYSSNRLRHKLQKLRIHDLYLKYKHQQVSDMFNKVIQEKGLNVLTKNPWKEVIDCEGKYFIASDFSNSNGIVDFKYIIRSFNKSTHFVHVFLGIQIQGQQLRYVLEIGGKGITENEKAKSFIISRELFDKCLWLTKPASINNLDVCDEFLHGKARDKKNGYPEFCSYSGCFVYKYSKIKSDTSVGKLLEYLDSLINHILDNKIEIQKIIDKEFYN